MAVDHIEYQNQNPDIHTLVLNVLVCAALVLALALTHYGPIGINQTIWFGGMKKTDQSRALGSIFILVRFALTLSSS